MPDYMFKKLPGCSSIVAVQSVRKNQRTAMRQLPGPFIVTGIPEFHFAAYRDGVLLPKRKRGEQFIVRYTIVEEKIL